MEVSRRDRIATIEEAVTSAEGSFVGDSDQCPLTHSFAPEMYVREIRMPAGMLVVGKIHRHAHPNFLMEGVVSVITEAGGVETLTAPCYMISPAGTKRVVYVLEDACWVTVHNNPRNTKDIEELEEQIIALDYLDEQLNQNQIEALERACLS